MPPKKDRFEMRLDDAFREKLDQLQKQREQDSYAALIRLLVEEDLRRQAGHPTPDAVAEAISRLSKLEKFVEDSLNSKRQSRNTRR